MSFFFLIGFTIFSAFAGLEKIQIKNLDLFYVYPQGTGELEKITAGVTHKKQNLSIEVFRRDDSFDVISPFIDLQWLNPIPFIHNMQKMSAQKLNLKIDYNQHYLWGESLKLTGDKTDESIFEKYDLNCQGTSREIKPLARLKEDCLYSMKASAKHMELPFQFLANIASQLPDESTETEGDIPANDFSFTVQKGDFSSHVRIKFIVNAYLKLWGHLRYEDEGKTLAIRLDLIKFGILPVTNLVMGELSRIRNPKITVNPPWVRIQLGNK